MSKTKLIPKLLYGSTIPIHQSIRPPLSVLLYELAKKIMSDEYKANKQAYDLYLKQAYDLYLQQGYKNPMSFLVFLDFIKSLNKYIGEINLDTKNEKNLVDNILHYGEYGDSGEGPSIANFLETPQGIALLFTPIGFIAGAIARLIDQNGVRKTINDVLNEKYSDAALSGLGDALEVGFGAPVAKKLIKKGLVRGLYTNPELMTKILPKPVSLSLAIDDAVKNGTTYTKDGTMLFTNPTMEGGLAQPTKKLIKHLLEAEKAGIPKAERNLIKRPDIDKINSYLIHRGVQPVENLSEDAILGMNDVFYSMKHHLNLKYIKLSDGTYKWQLGGNYSSDPIYWNPNENFEVVGKRRNSITGPVGISNIKGLGDLAGRIEGIDIIPMEYTLRMTSPKVENVGSQLSFIPKPLVKEFSINFNKMVRPGSYYSADNVGTPIGLLLKRNIEDANKMREILIKPRNNFKNVDGLSTDSYAWLLSLGTRPGLELRYADNPMYGFNSQSHYGKEYMDLLKQVQNSKESFSKKQEFLDKWNNFIRTKNPAARPAYIDSKGDIAIPHPFIYKTGVFKMGGNLIKQRYLKEFGKLYLK